eukprot:CAMPEP_0179121662 /NCGR_PEP_ID=MMETSP0796-20121207/57388_1 /TAXON_ID=73915 /ORGANISM="Pyrodinium bahamense, Strain pbaha01" /LENGTH=244 /DNA_ID=CAMNT_0020820265 /DNA_START=75 /DNA_END=809 /DNA_ORIENTATION=+
MARAAGAAAAVSMVLAPREATDPAAPRGSGGRPAQAVMLAVIVVFAAVFVVASARAEQALQDTRDRGGSSARRCAAEKSVMKPSTELFRGVVKRYSTRNGWGLLTAVETWGEMRAEKGQTPGGDTGARRDVRFYRQDLTSLGLAVGDVVTFRVVADTNAPGWSRAVQIRRAAPVGPAEAAPAAPASPSGAVGEPQLPPGEPALAEQVVTEPPEVGCGTEGPEEAGTDVPADTEAETTRRRMVAA